MWTNIALKFAFFAVVTGSTIVPAIFRHYENFEYQISKFENKISRELQASTLKPKLIIISEQNLFQIS